MGTKNTFIPVLSIGSGIMDLGFYKDAFGAIELWRLNNPDGSVHVAAFSMNGAEFRFHEESKDGRNQNAGKAGYTTVTIALSADDVQAVVAKAVTSGATVVSPVIDYEYGYRQGEIKDPFGHHWLIEKLFSKEALDGFLASLK